MVDMGKGWLSRSDLILGVDPGRNVDLQSFFHFH